MSEKAQDAQESQDYDEDSEDEQPSVLRMILSDWIFLAVLGVLTALLSATTDTIVMWFQQIHELSIEATTGTNFMLMYTIWIIFFTLMVVTSSSLAHYFAPQVIGSGVPEMKTILRGVILKDYLTFRTFLTKVIGLIFSLGSGTPIGKMGPFVHISSLLANQLWIFVARFDRTFRSDARRIETLTAACAIGVACVFSAPIGGVLFSIEVTTTYFSVRNYWRGFFGACCGAITFRLLNGIFAETTVATSAFFQTYFPKDPFSVQELPIFAFLGLICGFLAACFIKIYKHLVLFLRTNRFAKNVFQKRWLLYPMIVSVLLSGITFPPGLGRFFVGHLRFDKNLRDFYLNCTFSADLKSASFCNEAHNCPFIDAKFHPIIMVALYVLSLFLLAILSQSLPIPCGIFMPTIVLGAAIGRLVGEITSQLWPNGLNEHHFVFPGVYAVAGSAAFCGAVTHSLSVSVVVFEATGQLHCLLPSLIAVIISNALCTYLQPSFFDTIIKIKHLPFLPDLPSFNNVHTMRAEKLMTKPVRFLCKATKYGEIKRILTEASQLKMFPVVDGEATQMLFGTVSRGTLLDILDEQIGDASRQYEAERRASEAIKSIEELENSVQITIENEPGRKLSSTLVNQYSNCRNFMMDQMQQAKKAMNILKGKRQNEISNSALDELIGTEESLRDLDQLQICDKKRETWEQERLNETFLFTEELVDPASFQIARRTTLSEIHSLFSMLKLTKSYVTEYGRLIGVVTLFDVRQALEKANKNPIKMRNDRKSSLNENESDIEEALKDVLTPAVEVISPRGKSKAVFSDGETAGSKRRSTRRRMRTGSVTGIDEHLKAIPETRRHTLAENQSDHFVTGIKIFRKNLHRK